MFAKGKKTAGNQGNCQNFEPTLLGDHSSITSSKRWVGGVSKWPFLMINSTLNHQRGGSHSSS